MYIRNHEKQTLLIALNAALSWENSYLDAVKNSDMSDAIKSTKKNIEKITKLRERLFGKPIPTRLEAVLANAKSVDILLLKNKKPYEL